MPPSSRIPHLPARHRRKSTGIAAGKGNRSTMFLQEQSFSGDCDRREIVGEEEEEEEDDDEVGNEEGEGEESGIGEETWRFQAEFLRAECKFLRVDRNLAAKKLEQNRALLERTLSSALQTLISGRKRMCEGKCTRAVLDSEIEDLSQKLRDVQRINTGGRECEIRGCLDFDRRVCVRRSRVQKIGDNGRFVKEVREISEANMSFSSATSRIDDKLLPNRTSDAANVENPRKKREGMEEFGSSLPTAIDTRSSLLQHHYQERTVGNRESTCSGHCKAVVKLVVEQLRAETEHWVQMQEMLVEVRQGMEHLQASRDFWADRAQRAIHQSHSLNSHLERWKRKAVASESKANQLQAQVCDLQRELENVISTRHVTAGEAKGGAVVREAQIKEMEKSVEIMQLKETYKERRGQSLGVVAPKPPRPPLQDMGNNNVSPPVKAERTQRRTLRPTKTRLSGYTHSLHARASAGMQQRIKF